ncbi:MAG: FAD-binding oxidoreductase [Ectothiorhodospiraceae bacterium]|nr:FAD-binding oxidoreductase [Ectothiorhodospiraceae bacterium]MCH8503642.1 FAD-binding oxidoreductase [Ectothiorhodospiraceae bacterium]
MDRNAREALEAIVGESGWITGVDQEPFLREWRNHYHGKAAAVVCPSSTEEVAGVMRVCHEAGISVVPQSGNTGLCGGAAPDESGSQILLSLRRLRQIRELDAVNFTMTVEAGCILADIQRAARDAGLLFPLSLAAEGSCMIGGNLGTNAGGINVLRYGNARDLTLGLEVVLADGRVWHGLTGLRKDNSRYDLRNLFIGSEGTLGIITAAVLKLFPQPRQTSTALLACESPVAAVAMLGRLRQASGDTMTACELMSRQSMRMALDHVEGCRDPFDSAYPWYLLVELSSAQQGHQLRGTLEDTLEQALEEEALKDGVIAESVEQTRQLWRIRESIPEGQVRAGASIKHDVAVAVSRVPDFLARATPLMERQIPGVRVCAFGHVGDGNLHFNLSVPEGGSADAFLQERDACQRLVHDLVIEMEGSVAAEHGVGQLKVAELERYKDPVELDLMRSLKQAMDPRGLLNPGKVIRALPSAPGTHER